MPGGRRSASEGKSFALTQASCTYCYSSAATEPPAGFLRFGSWEGKFGKVTSAVVAAQLPRWAARTRGGGGASSGLAARFRGSLCAEW